MLSSQTKVITQILKALELLHRCSLGRADLLPLSCHLYYTNIGKTALLGRCGVRGADSFPGPTWLSAIAARRYLKNVVSLTRRNIVHFIEQGILVKQGTAKKV